MHILAVNINGVTCKLERYECITFFCKYEIICLSELKTTYPFGIPGFECVRSLVIPGEEQRGGVAVLFRSDLWLEVFSIRRERDQIWFKIRSAPGFDFCAIYNTPTDSPYFDPCVMSLVQSNVKTSSDKHVIIGDTNARLGDLSCLNDLPHGVTYSPNIDPTVNKNGKTQLNLCKTCDIKPVNHLQFHSQSFPGKLTFKQGSDRWISQLDWCLISANALKHVNSFDILQSASLPTNHAPLSLTLSGFEPSLTDLVTRAKWLGQSSYSTPPIHRKPIPFSSVSPPLFKQSLPEPSPEWSSIADVNSLATKVADTLYDTAVLAKPPIQHPERDTNPAKSAHERWIKLVNSQDSRAIWKAIDWNGKLTTEPNTQDSPSDAEFCKHYDKLMNPPVPSSEKEYVPDCHRYIPILDDPFTPDEVSDCIKDLKSNKAPGVDGVPPGVLKFLSVHWLLLVTFLFNCVFYGSYPLQWAVAKVFNIFKKGFRLDPGNYRGISIMNALAKLYDMVLCRRLQIWYKCCFQQAGSQKGRGCEEQIFVIRLLIDIARKCGFTLFIGVIDYQKAYDKVKRFALLDRLHKKGCGTIFLMAISAALVCSSGLIGSQLFDTSAGVRQGASSSCPLFVFFIDATIEAINSYGPDGWLDTLHTLLLMDDTVIFATSKAALQAKLRLLKQSADKLGMEIHPTKSKFLAINSDDKTPIVIDTVIVSYTNLYLYLGSFISMEPISLQMKHHFDDKYKQVLKFYTFLYKNNDVPYHVKRSVWDSAVKSSLFYGAETWITNDLSIAESTYLATVKRLLAVRTSTNTDIVLLEAGLPSPKAYIKQKQHLFIHKLLSRDNFWDSYIGKTVSLSLRYKSDSGRILKKLIDTPPEYDFAAASLNAMKQRVLTSSLTRHEFYRHINPSMSLSHVYTPKSSVPEYHRIAFTRLRLMSHRLRIETGRWTRPKTPIERRLCRCGLIQTEEHALLECPLTDHLRSDFINGFSSIVSLFDLMPDSAKCVSQLCYDVLKIFT